MSHLSYRYLVSASIGAAATFLLSSPAFAQSSEAASGHIERDAGRSPGGLATIDGASPAARRRAPALGGGPITSDYRYEDANQACGELEDGEATCSLAEGPFEDGIEYAERGDIVLRLEDGLGIVPGQGRAGIIAYSELGGQGSISIQGAAATIDVQDASGVVAVASGDVSIDLASVAARAVSEGELAWGIEAVSQIGNVRVDVGSVDVSGPLSAGIRTQSSLGDIAINAGSVSASGSEATGIFAMNSEGAIQIDADTVQANGDYASAIVVLNDRGWTNINVGALSTNGFSSDGIYAEGVGSLAVRVGSFETNGDYNWGANIVRLSGTAAPEEYGSVFLDFGKVKLDGTNNAAIDYLGYGRVDVNIGQFEADGAYNMIAAIDAYDAVRVQVGEAVVRGEWNDGIIASSQIGRVDVIVGSIDIAGSGIGAVSSLGDVTVTAGVVRTRGDGGAGIAAGTEAGTSVAINVSDVSTDGSQARGIRGVAYHGTVQIAVDNVSTNGAYSDGVVSYAGRSVVLVRENVTTNGEESRGLIVSGFEGDAFVQADGRVSTDGLFSEGIWANARHGTATVIAGGEVSTAGDESVGIRAEGRAGDVRVDAAIVRTSGTESHGIMARTQHAGPRPVQTGLGVPGAPVSAWGGGAELAVRQKLEGEAAVANQAGEGIVAGNIDIRVSEVSVTGEGSHGVSARGLGAARILAGDVSAVWGQAIETDMIGNVDIDLRGQASSRHGAAITARAANVSLLIGPGARVVGVTDGIVVDAVGPRCISPLPNEPVPGLCPNPGDPEPIIGPFAPSAAGVGGQVSLVNSGVIEAGTGYAVRAVSGVVALENHGQISGAISFADGDDLFDNRGLFLLSGNSDFGGGVDMLRNSGTVRLAAGSSRLDGLDRFENGGLIDLGNDRVGDVLTLAGDYVGIGNAMVRLDVGGEGRTSDSLVIEGAASGSTRLALAGKPVEAKLTDGAGVVLIRVAGETTEDAFVLEQDSRDIGLVRYSMKHDAEAGTYRLIGRAGAGAYRLLGTMQAIDTATVASADLWRAQGLARRDVQLSGGDSVAVPRLWGLLEGGRVSRDWSSRGDEDAVELSHRQTRYGGQIGYDLFGAGDDGARWRFGLTGGYTGSKLNYRGTSDRAELSSANAGIYAAYVGDRVFANLLVKYVHHDLDVASTAFAAKQKLKASSFGTEGEVGLRFGDAGMFVEPTLGLAWMRSRIDDLVNETQRLDFEDATNVKGRLGARFGGSSRFKNGALLTIYASGNAVHSFGDDYALTVTSGASERIEGGRLGTYGEGSLGIAYRPAAGIEAFAEGRAEFGSGYDGLTGRIGVRLGF